MTSIHEDEQKIFIVERHGNLLISQIVSVIKYSFEFAKID